MVGALDADQLVIDADAAGPPGQMISRYQGGYLISVYTAAARPAGPGATVST